MSVGQVASSSRIQEPLSPRSGGVLEKQFLDLILRVKRAISRDRECRNSFRDAATRMADKETLDMCRRERNAADEQLIIVINQFWQFACENFWRLGPVRQRQVEKASLNNEDVTEQAFSICTNAPRYSFVNISAVLTGMGGTTVSFPFMNEALAEHFMSQIEPYLLEHSNESIVAESVRQIKEIAKCPNATVQEVAQIIKGWKKDRVRHEPLTALEIRVLEKGLMKGKGKNYGGPDLLQSALHRDSIDKILFWRSRRVMTYVFSSEPAAMQKLIFTHSQMADVSSCFWEYFDGALGDTKKDSSYAAIAGKLAIPPAEILFLTASKEEYDAAQRAGMNAVLVVRKGEPPADKELLFVSNFNQIGILTA